VERRPTCSTGDFEWSALSRVRHRRAAGRDHGVVSGRRRQGKTYLLDAICQQAGGFYFAPPRRPRPSRSGCSARRSPDHTRPPTPFHFADWHEAVDALLALGADRPGAGGDRRVPVPRAGHAGVAVDHPTGVRRRRRANRSAREPGCCSAGRRCRSWVPAVGNAPLRGRAGLELVVPPRTTGWPPSSGISTIHGSPCRSTPWSRHARIPARVRPQRRAGRPGRLRPLGAAHGAQPGEPAVREADTCSPRSRNCVTRRCTTRCWRPCRRQRDARGIARLIWDARPDVRHPLTVLEDAGRSRATRT